MAPAGTPVIGPIEASLAPGTVGQRVDPVRTRGRNRDAGTAGIRREAVARHVAPVIAAIVRDIEAAARTVGWRIGAPRRPPGLPQRRINSLRVARLEGEIDGAGVGILVENFRPVPPAITRTEDAALRIGAVGMTQGSDVHQVGILWIDQNARDLAGVGQADLRPVRATVRGLVHAVALRDVGAPVGFARSHVEGPRAGRRDRQGSDRAHRLAVEDRLPRPAGVLRGPYAA